MPQVPDSSWFDQLEDAPNSGPQQPMAAPPQQTAPQPQDKKDQNPGLPSWANPPRSMTASAQPPPQSGGGPGNIAGAVPSGLYAGLASTVNLPTNLINGGLNLARNFGLPIPDGRLTPPINENPTGYQPKGPIAQGTYDASKAASSTAAMGGAAKLLTPMLPTGSAVQTVSEALSNTPPSVIAGAAAGGAAEEPVAKNVPEVAQPYARMLTNVGAGSMATGAERALANAGRSSITPEAANLANLAINNYNIPLRAAQVSDNRMVKQADSVLQSVPFSGYSGVNDETRSATQRAISNTFGEDADKITPQLLNQAARRIGGNLEAVENGNVVNFDNHLINDLAGIEANARNGLTDEEYGVVSRQINNILSKVQTGDTIQGETYGNLMGYNSPLSRAAANKNPNISGFAADIKEAMRDSLQRSLSPEDAATYTAARAQWKNLKTIEPLTQNADIVGGASPSTGDINFNNLRAAVNKSYPNAARANPGDIPLNDISDISQRFLKELPTSQTAERGNMMRWMERAGALAGGGGFVGEHFGVPVHEYLGPAAAAGAAAVIPPWLAARGASSVLRSEGLANRMVNRALNPQTAMEAGREGAQQAAVPLLTASGVREAEPPPPPTSRNPATGLPEFSLEANKQAASGDMSGQIASQMLDGSLSDHKALTDFINQNKRQLRVQFGGQGIQNIMKVGALVRRATTEPTPSTVLSAVLKGASPDVLAKAGDAQGLITQAISNPELMQALSTRTKGSLNKLGQNRLMMALSGQDGTDTGPAPAVRGAPQAGADVEAGARNPDAPRQPQPPPAKASPRIAAGVGV